METSMVWIVTETEWCGGYREGGDVILKAFKNKEDAEKYKKTLEDRREELEKIYYSYSFASKIIDEYDCGDKELLEKISKRKDLNLDMDKFKRTLELIRSDRENDEYVVEELMIDKSWNIEEVELC